MKKIQKKRLLIGVIIAVIGGIIMFGLHHKAQLEKQAELERNREYEVSLVNTLKNTYAGIKEVRIKDPVYSDKPSDSWGADIRIIFDDEYKLEHVMAYDLKTKEIRLGIYSKEEQETQNILQSRTGQTVTKVLVYYSNGQKGEQ